MDTAQTSPANGKLGNTDQWLITGRLLTNQQAQYKLPEPIRSEMRELIVPLQARMQDYQSLSSLWLVVLELDQT